jgi:rsbT co-antagonist protein RsbR
LAVLLDHLGEDSVALVGQSIGGNVGQEFIFLAACLREGGRLPIRHQAIRILELSTPFIPVSDGVVVMPLIGTLNAARAEQLLATLLGGLEGTHAEVAVIDVTGVPALDRGSADLLRRAAHAARLLGARTFLTGVRPEVARALIDLNVDFHGIEMRGSLKNALHELLRATRRDR